MTETENSPQRLEANHRPLDPVQTKLRDENIARCKAYAALPPEQKWVDGKAGKKAPIERVGAAVRKADAARVAAALAAAQELHPVRVSLFDFVEVRNSTNKAAGNFAGGFTLIKEISP